MTNESQSHVPQPLISIIIATYNAENYINSCLESITSQSQKDLEILIIDGGSTDNTIEIIQKHKYLNLALLSEKDNGIYDALNKGTKLAKGRWVYFLGADDRLLKEFSDLAEKLENENTIYYGNSEPLDRLLSGEFSNYRLAKYCMNHQSILYPASVFKKYSYNLRYKVLADYALNLQLWGDKNFHKEYHNFTIVNYCMDGFSSKNKDVLFIKDRAKLIRKNMGWLIYIRFLYRKYRNRNNPQALEM